MSMPCFTAVDRDRDHRQVGARDFSAERGRKTEAERALIPAMDVAARAVDRERHAPDIADLRQILDINAVLGQLGTDRVEVFALRAELVGERGASAGLQSLELVSA